MHPLEKYFRLIEENYANVILNEFHDFATFYSSFDPTIFNGANMVKNGALERLDQKFFCHEDKTMLKLTKENINDHVLIKGVRSTVATIDMVPATVS